MTGKHHTYKFTSTFFGTKLFWSLFILILVHSAGAIGMAFYDTQLFSAMTPYNLVLMFVLLIWNQAIKNIQFLNAILVAFYVGMIVELIGVNTQLLFGHYSYGTVLGLKFVGVPILIGLNWFIIVYSAYQSAGFILKSIYVDNYNPEHKRFTVFLQPLLTSIIAVLFDWLMEPVALKLGFWFWQENMIPLFNYTCWFIFSFFISLSFSTFQIRATNRFALFMILVQTLFFIFLRIFLN